MRGNENDNTPRANIMIGGKRGANFPEKLIGTLK